MISRSLIKRRRSKPRRGRIADKDYLEWIHTQPCIVSGHPFGVTAHHVRRFGEPKNDYRTVPLLPCFHMSAFGPLTVEHGKRKFERVYSIDLEQEIVRLNRFYVQQTGKQISCIESQVAQ